MGWIGLFLMPGPGQLLVFAEVSSECLKKWLILAELGWIFQYTEVGLIFFSNQDQAQVWFFSLTGAGAGFNFSLT